MTQPVAASVYGSTLKVSGSGTIRKSPAPVSSGMPMPPPGAKKSTPTACPVSKTNGPGLMSMPLRSAVRKASTVRVLERISPCGSPKPTRTNSSEDRVSSSAAAAARRSSLHRPCRSTKPTLPVANRA